MFPFSNPHGFRAAVGRMPVAVQDADHNDNSSARIIAAFGTRGSYPRNRTFAK